MKYRLVIILMMFMFVGSSANAQTFQEQHATGHSQFRWDSTRQQQHASWDYQFRRDGS